VYKRDSNDEWLMPLPKVLTEDSDERRGLPFTELLPTVEGESVAEKNLLPLEARLRQLAGVGCPADAPAGVLDHTAGDGMSPKPPPPPPPPPPRSSENSNKRGRMSSVGAWLAGNNPARENVGASFTPRTTGFMGADAGGIGIGIGAGPGGRGGAMGTAEEEEEEEEEGTNDGDADEKPLAGAGGSSTGVPIDPVVLVLLPRGRAWRSRLPSTPFTWFMNEESSCGMEADMAADVGTGGGRCGPVACAGKSITNRARTHTHTSGSGGRKRRRGEERRGRAECDRNWGGTQLSATRCNHYGRPAGAWSDARERSATTTDRAGRTKGNCCSIQVHKTTCATPYPIHSYSNPISHPKHDRAAKHHCEARIAHKTRLTWPCNKHAPIVCIRGTRCDSASNHTCAYTTDT